MGSLSRPGRSLIHRDEHWTETEAWIERQRKILESNPSRFNRVILNIPGGIDGGLITTAELQAALAPIREPAALTDRCWAAVDLGVRFDWTAVLIGHVDNEAKLVVDVIRTWRPTPDKAVSLLDVTDELRSLYRRFPWTDLRLDQSQSRLIAEMLQRDSIPCWVERSDLELESVDVDGIIAFAQIAISEPVRFWDAASPAQRARFVEALFPSGLVYSVEGFRTPLTGCGFRSWASSVPSQEGLASPAGSDDTYWLLPLAGDTRRAA